MMEQVINWILMLLFIAKIDLGFSAVFFPFQHRQPEDDYKNSRSASVHRGIILSLSFAQRIEMCKDLFSQYYENVPFPDDLHSGAPNPTIRVGKIGYFSDVYSVQSQIEDVFFLCSGKNYRIKNAYDIEFFVSSAFQRGLMYSGSKDDVSSTEAVEIMVDSYIGMSPEYVSLEQTELERQYIASRRAIEALKKESPEYMKLIEEQDDLSQLTVWQKYLLCSSIIWSPAHEKDRREFRLYWGHYKKNADTGNHQYKKKELKIATDDHKEENLLADCLYCTASAKAVSQPSDRTKNLLVTRAYNDKNSFYILIEERGVVRLKEYIENSPILMNARVPFTNDPE